MKPMPVLQSRSNRTQTCVWVASFILAASAIGAPSAGKDSPRDARPLRIEVTGHEFQWHVHYPGPDGDLGTSDDVRAMQDVHLPINQNVILELHSKDYVYSFALPHLDLKEIAVPDLTFSLSFKTDTVGTFELLGDQMCGYAHPQLLGKLIVTSAKEFESWSETGRPRDYHPKKRITDNR